MRQVGWLASKERVSVSPVMSQCNRHAILSDQVANEEFAIANPIPKLSIWRSLKRLRTKRKTTLIGGCSVVALTFLINMSALVYMSRHSVHEAGAKPLNPRLYLGSCSKSSRINTCLHIGINVLSTLLLASSNMYMQLLLAPTRAQVDQAHQRQQWLDVGVLNLKNLRIVRWRSRLLWFILAFSSLPLHLL